tara:strand:+ start:76 stop:684 length:609 start_codon:yes stop_codon:yes gene_type:complete
MKNLLLTLTLLISFVFFGQDNKVTFKDGSTFDGSTFIESCIDSTGAERSLGINFCNCMLQNLANRLTFDEFIEFNKSISNQVNANTSSARVANNLLKNNELIKEISTDCSSIFNTDNSFVSPSNDNVTVLAEEHLLNIKNEIGLYEYTKLGEVYNLKEYSICFVTKMFDNFTTSSMMTMSEVDTKRLETIQESCFNENQKQN